MKTNDEISPEMAYRKALNVLMGKYKKGRHGEVAEAAKMSAGQLTKIKTGERRGRLDDLILLAKEFDTTIEHMISIGYKELKTTPPDHLSARHLPYEITNLIGQLDPTGINYIKKHIENYLSERNERKKMVIKIQPGLLKILKDFTDEMGWTFEQFQNSKNFEQFVEDAMKKIEAEKNEKETLSNK